MSPLVAILNRFLSDLLPLSSLSKSLLVVTAVSLSYLTSNFLSGTLVDPIESLDFHKSICFIMWSYKVLSLSVDYTLSKIIDTEYATQIMGVYHGWTLSSKTWLLLWRTWMVAANSSLKIWTDFIIALSSGMYDINICSLYCFLVVLPS